MTTNWMSKAQDLDVWHIAADTNGIYYPIEKDNGYFAIRCINGDYWDFRCSTLNLSDFFNTHLNIMIRCANEFNNLKYKFANELEKY